MPKAKKPASPRPQQLLVEGKNDKHVIWALCQHHQLPETFSVEVLEDGEGIQALLDSLPTRLRQESLQALGIVVDADLNPGLAGRWDALRSCLMNYGYLDIPKLIDLKL